MRNNLLAKILLILIIIGITIIGIIIGISMINKKVNSIKEITADQFKQKLSDKGYYISSSMNEQSPKYLAKDQTHDIKFYEAQTDEDALTNVFLKEKEAIVKEQNKKVEKDISIKKYNYYEVKANDKVYIVIKNGKTVIITKIDQNKEKEIKSILKEVNYIL